VFCCIHSFVDRLALLFYPNQRGADERAIFFNTYSAIFFVPWAINEPIGAL